MLGLAFMGLVPWLQRDVRVHRVPAVGLVAAPFLGFLFGLGWTPCIGPTLGVILTLTYNETSARGGLLLAFYSLGLGIPFVAAALALAPRPGSVRLGAPPPGVGDARRRAVPHHSSASRSSPGWWAEAVAWLQIHLISDFQVSV